MGIKIGGLDITATALDTEYRVGVLELVLDLYISRVGTNVLTEQDLERIRAQVVDTMKKKYPDMKLAQKKEVGNE